MARGEVAEKAGNTVATTTRYNNIVRNNKCKNSSAVATAMEDSNMVRNEESCIRYWYLVSVAKWRADSVE